MILPVKYYRNLRFDVFPLRPKLKQYFSDNPFDIIHMATQGHMGILALYLASKFQLPVISCYHTAIPEYARDRFLKVLGNNPVGRSLAKLAFDMSWWYQRLLFRNSKLILVPTASIEAVVRENLGVPTAFFTRGVDGEAFSPARRDRPDGGPPITLYAGRISIEKNLKLLEKLKLPQGENQVFIGDGPYVPELKRRLPKAHFTGFLTGKDLQKAYANGDIFVFPSKTDTFGNAVLEAMSSGLPVVVTDVLGPKDFVKHSETGFIARNDEEFIEFHRLLLEDDELRARMGRNAREYALTCNWDSIFENQLIGNYRTVISGAVESQPHQQ
jgi:glycosyltransferase involved in cell wall biosynthesis